jgi:UDP-N-acetylmuramate--alanine ligase
VFQPHRYSRTAQFKAEFAASLALADSVHLLDVYPAGESPGLGGTTADVYAELKRGAPLLPVSYLPGDGPGRIASLLREAKPGDLVAFVGAGDIDQERGHGLMPRGRRQPARSGGTGSPRWCARFFPRGPGSPGRSPWRRKTTLRVGGAARLYAEPAERG